MGNYLLAFSISLLGLFFLFFNTIYGFKIKKSIAQKAYNFFISYITIMLIIEIFCHVIGFLKPGSNIFISHFYFNFQFILVSAFFVFLFQHSRKIQKRIIAISTVVFCIIICSYLTGYFSFWEFNLLEIGLTSLVLVLYIFFYFNVNLERKNVPFYHFFAGLAVYLLSSCLIFLTGNVELVFVQEPLIDIWVFNSILYILFQYFIFKELKNFKIKKSK